jgi:SAM-dependent methyltransferase
MTHQVGESRLLVFVMAHRSETHVCDFFDRIPTRLFNRRDVHFLVCDDASDDSTLFRLNRWLTDHNVQNVTLIQTGLPQGDGGTQKLGFRAAIDGGFDAVVRLRADHGAPAEYLCSVIDAWNSLRADVLVTAGRDGGTWWRRMLSWSVTVLQNRLMDWHLRSSDSEVRVFSTAFLESVPFETNSNGDRFDAEVLTQAKYAGALIEEVTLAEWTTTHRRFGLRRAMGILATTLQFKAHQMGMLCSLKLRRLTSERYGDKTQVSYSSHALALNVIRAARPRTVLDIGCGPGHVAGKCREQGISVTGVDLHQPAQSVLSEFHAVDLEHDSLPADVWDFDVVLLLDVIEHLADPEKFLLAQRHGQRQRPSVGNSPLFVISTPNVAFIAVRLNLLLGRFNYAERGILDITHKRLFTRCSLLRLLDECGYRVERCHAVGVPFAAVIEGRLGRVLGRIANHLARWLPALFAFQFLVECRPHPGARQLLDQALRTESDRDIADVALTFVIK